MTFNIEDLPFYAYLDQVDLHSPVWGTLCTQSLHLPLVGRQELGQLREEAAAERAVRDCQGGMKPHCLPKILFGVSKKKVTFDHAPKRLVFAGLILISAWL